MTEPVEIYRAFVAEEAVAAAERATPGPLSAYQAFQECLSMQDYGRLGEVVDLAGYTENCLGLTGWTTGFERAWRNYQQNMIAPFQDMTFTVDEMVEGQHTVVVRTRVEATHTGTFSGLAATGRRIAWDNIAIVHVKDGRVVGQWAQPDLQGIVQQLTAAGTGA
jgi:predicted ester cyclase